MSVYYQASPPASPPRTYFPSSPRRGSSFGYFGSPAGSVSYAPPYTDYVSSQTPAPYYSPSVNGGAAYYQPTFSGSTVAGIAEGRITTTTAMMTAVGAGTVAGDEEAWDAGVAAVAMMGGMIHDHVCMEGMRKTGVVDVMGEVPVVDTIMEGGGIDEKTTAVCAADLLFGLGLGPVPCVFVMFPF
ncbi:hypothetical protein M0805_004925 [Coniferiporia weirii]|nr:hypothetical protein M0805_004925 [Coniferiporia weirii]